MCPRAFRTRRRLVGKISQIFFSVKGQQRTPGATVDTTCAHFESVDGGERVIFHSPTSLRELLSLRRDRRRRGGIAKGTLSAAYETLGAVIWS